VERIRAYRLKRSAGAVQDALTALKSGAQGDSNLMQLVLNAVRHECTLGEISDALRAVYGEYREYSGF